MEDENKMLENEELKEKEEQTVVEPTGVIQETLDKTDETTMVKEQPTISEFAVNQERPNIEIQEQHVVGETELAQKEVNKLGPTQNEKKGHAKAFWILLILIIIIGTAAAVLFTKYNEDKKGISNEVVSKPKKSDYRLSGNSLEAFDLYFLQLENEKVNKIYSPLSIKYALEMLMEGAEGDSKEQIAAVIGDYEARTYTNSENMSFANVMFIRDTFKDAIKQDYINKIKSKFGAEVVFDPFESANTINSWVKNKTLNLLDNLVDNVSDLDFALVNALAIDMEWEERFFDFENWESIKHPTVVFYEHEKFPGLNNKYFWMSLDDVYGGKFENIDEEVSTLRLKASFNRYDIIKELGEENIRKTVEEDYRKFIQENSEDEYLGFKNLNEEEIDEKVKEYLDDYIKRISENYNEYAYNTEFSLYVDDDVKVFAKDLKEYNGTTLQYVAIMPTSVSLDSYVSNVDASKVNTLISNLKPLKLESFKDGVVTEIEGYVPKFKFEYALNLKEDLAKLGITDVFDLNKSKLTGITETKQFIESAKHKANIEFTQYGIKAAAATYLGGAGAAAMYDYFFDVPYEKIDLTFDKPFVFIIRDKSTGEVWFTGTVYNPLLFKDDTTKKMG